MSEVTKLEPVSGIVIEAEPVSGIPVTLVGKDYMINQPKSALSMRMAVESKKAGDDPGKVFEILDVWIDKAFGKENAKKVRKRLDDENDLLDIQHVMTLMEKIIEVQTDGNPTS